MPNGIQDQGENIPFGNISGRLRALMYERGLKQTQIAEAVGCSQGAVSKYLAGRPPSTAELFRIAKFLGVPMESLLSGEPAPAPDQPQWVVQEQRFEYGRKELAAEVLAEVQEEVLRRLPEIVREAFENIRRNI